MSTEQNTDELFADLRKTVAGDTSPAQTPSEATEDTAATQALPEVQSPTEPLPKADPLPAYSPAATGEAPRPAGPGPSMPNYHQAPQGPAPAMPPTPVAPVAAPPAQRSGVRVGLLVWAAILIAAGLMILGRVFFPFASAPVVVAILMGGLGVIFLIGAITASVKRKN